MAENSPEKKEQQPTFASESRLFLKTAGGGQSDHTLKTYQTGLDYFRSYLEEQYSWTEARPIADLQPDFFDELPTWLLKQRYQRSKRSAPTPLAESTRSLYLLAITRFLRFLVLRNPLPHFGYAEYDRIKEELGKATNVKEKPVAQKIPGQELVAALLEAARTPPETNEEMPATSRHRLRLIWRRNLAMVLALSSSGMRVGELVKLKREDLDYSRQGAWVLGKGRKTRFVAFNQEAWQAIEAYLQERYDEALMVQLNQHPLFCRHDRSAPTDSRLPLTVRTVQLVIEGLSEQADVARRFNLSPHSLRHYFANGLLQFTGNLALVQEALGHQDPKTTRGYTKIKAEEIAAQVQAMARRTAEEEEASEA